VHKRHRHRLAVIGRLADVITEGQSQGRQLVVKPGGQHTRGIEQIKRLAQPHPAQAAGDAGAPSAVDHLLTHQPVDQGRFAHVGETEHQRPHWPWLHAAAGASGIERFAGANGRLLQLLDARARLGITPPHLLVMLTEPGAPALANSGGHHVEPVEHQQMQFAVDPTLQPRMTGRQRDAGIAHFDHQIHLAQSLVQRLLGLGDVARVPLDLRSPH
jgi:hypothetical protein